MNPLIQRETTILPLLIGLALACFALAPLAEATPPPKPEDRGNGNSAAENVGALNIATTGSDNTAHGWFSLFSNTTGGGNTANGAQALYSNTTGTNNTGNGVAALLSNTTGELNTANGVPALFSNTTGALNTANGVAALYNNTTGNFNTANGADALPNNVTGSGNTANGVDALYNNTAGLDISGSGNVCIGAGVFGAVGPNNTTWIKNVYASVASARAVFVNSDNKIGTLSSSRRYNDEIRPIAMASEAILSLRPVSFRYKKEVDPTRSLSFGLIAEEVAEVDPDLVTPDRDGKPETVRYEAINAMLLNEFLKEHRRVEEQDRKVQEHEATITQLKSTVVKQDATAAHQQKQIEALTVGLQKVSAQVEMSRPAPQTVAYDQ